MVKIKDNYKKMVKKYNLFSLFLIIEIFLISCFSFISVAGSKGKIITITGGGLK